MNDTNTLFIFFTMFILGMLSLLISLVKCSGFILLDLFTYSILCYKDTNTV